MACLSIVLFPFDITHGACTGIEELYVFFWLSPDTGVDPGHTISDFSSVTTISAHGKAIYARHATRAVDFAAAFAPSQTGKRVFTNSFANH